VQKEEASIVKVITLLERKGTAVATIGPGATISQAVSELARNGVGALVVSSDGSHIDGILSERDIVRGLEGDGGSMLGQPVSGLMSTTVHSASPESDTDALMSMMSEKRIRHVPILDASGALAGIVSIGDVVKARIDELEKDRKELVDYINAR
jgi:CBS domain-containing protein